ncbi:helix-turn-helix domain-containing protein [Caproicibacterium argilliputei]|uniref:Helix-turn-helix domain-containing protein n=1 Tax=Caproicibacterium argilliputei TaxID=3030016 RepID=A0AA97H272_9FIRM|nr:helix-turn-helix domain-containing protein [Caproicibacterium argilliputei]WOC33238.1 helix-turn-helix domain-containing protein [Caproicibacterium argilliputei]
MKTPIHLGQQLRTLRTKNGYTQQQVSELLNLDRSTYAYYETNRTTPPLSTLKQIAAIFNVSVATLLENDDNMPLVSDPEGLTFTEFDHNMSHIYELRPEERRLVALFRLSDTETKSEVLTELSDQVQESITQKKR